MFTKLNDAVLNVLASKRGAAMVEYALLAGLVAVVAMATLTTLGTNIKAQFDAIAVKL